MTAPGPRVFLADDDAFQLHYLGGILRAAGHVVEAFDRPEALLGRLGEGDLGCVVLDLQMPVLNGLELQRALAERDVVLPMIFVSGHADVPAAVAAMKRGAVDFLSKPVDPGELCAAVTRALVRDAGVAVERAARAEARALWATLTPREQEVARLFAQGLLNKQVAAALRVTGSTAQTQRARALQKLGLSTPAEVGHFLARVDRDR